MKSATRRKKTPSVYRAAALRIAEKPEGGRWETLVVPGAAPTNGIDVGDAIAAHVDPANLRPKIAGDIEVKEFHLRWGADYAMIANPRDLLHYQVDMEELALIRRMDGTRSVKELVLERFEETGDLQLSQVADLVRTLFHGNFLEHPFVDVPAATVRALDPASLPRRKLRRFATTLTIEWSGAQRLVSWLHRRFTRWLFNPPAMVIGTAAAVFGVVAFLSIARSGRFSLHGESLALGVIVLLALDYFMVFVHELGHASVLVHHGRRVRGAGFQIYFGSPTFFVDSSDGLMLDKKYQILESLGGPYAQLLLGAVCSSIAWLWPEWWLSETLYRFSVINYLVIFMNLIPLLELDGYWILADVIQVPDLRPRSLTFMRYDLWHKLRVRERFSKQEIGLGVYGFAGIAFTVFSFYTAYFYWRTIFGDLVAGLWNGGLPSRALLILLALFILGPVFRGALRLVRVVARRIRSLGRAIRFRLEQGWRVEAAELIDALPIFDDLPVETLNDLAGRVALQSVDRGQPVVRQGGRADAFYVVRRGTLVVIEEHPDEGTERTLRTLGRGEAFGELGLVEAAPRKATVRAAERSEVFRIEKGAFDRLLADAVNLPDFGPTVSAIGELRALPCFAHLEPDELSELAEHGEWLNIAPATEIVRQGEEGRDFFAIGSGQVEVIRDGGLVGRLGSGKYFGEIALLLDVPRTATVRAQTPVRAYRLDREGFEELVAGAFRRGTLNPNAPVGRAQHH